MTDKEIIKALECCKKDDCDNCPNDFGNCYANLAGCSLDLINRKQTEIERLQKVNDSFTDIGKLYSEIKVEAIKDFAERLKEKLGDCYIVSDGEYCGFDCGDIHRTITNLLKEMAGETE